MNEFATTLNNTDFATSVHKQYTCGICGRIHATVEERMKCEASCVEHKKKAEEAAKKKKLEEEKVVRKKEIEIKYKELANLVASFVKDYGSLQIGEKRLFDDDAFPSIGKVLGWWM